MIRCRYCGINLNSAIDEHICSAKERNKHLWRSSQRGISSTKMKSIKKRESLKIVNENSLIFNRDERRSKDLN